MQVGQNASQSGNSFNKLAQRRTTSQIPLKGKNSILVQGKGTDLQNIKAINGRATRKLISQKRTLELIKVSKRKKDNEATKQYWNIFHCQRKVVTANGKLYGRFCKNRACVVCCSIREALLINKYSPVVSKWEDPHFVGLTLRAVPAKKLKFYVDAMYRAFELIIQRLQKRAKRGKGPMPVGFKTLESEFNATALTYNPHFNVIVANKEIGEAIRAEWCKIWTRRFVNPAIQYCERVRSQNKVMKEVIKYCTKTFSAPHWSKKIRECANPKLYIAAFHNILKAMKGHRVFDRFGFNLPKRNEVIPKGGTVTEVEVYVKWKYDLRYFDWVGEDTASGLSIYEPEPRLLHLLNNCMDILIE